MKDGKPPIIEYPTGVQQSNIESELAEIKDKKCLEGLIPIKTRRFNMILHDHDDALQYGLEIGAKSYYRTTSMLSITYKYY